MKVIFFTENLYRGGLDSYLVGLLSRWPQDDDLVLVCNRSHPGLSFLQARLGNRCRVIGHDIAIYPDLIAKANHSLLSAALRKALAPLLRYGYLAWYLLALPRLFRELRADRLVVVNGGHPGGDSCRAAVFTWRGPERPIYCFHNLSVAPRWYETGVEYVLDRALIQSTGMVVTVSRACVASLVNRPAFTSAQIKVIYNGVAEPNESAEKLAPTLWRSFGIPAEARICLLLATYEPRKGHEFLLRVFPRVLDKVPNAFLLICGSGKKQEFDRVKQLVSEHGLDARVRLEHFRDDAMALLREADLLIVPSQSFESFGLTVVEAMARHVPVVSTDVGGLPEVLKNGQGGFCVDHEDEAGFADAIISLLENQALYDTQAILGYARYRDLFTIERMVQSYVAIVRSG